MSPDLSEFARRVAKPVHPKGWEPSLQWDGQTGQITAQLDAEPDEERLLEREDEMRRDEERER